MSERRCRECGCTDEDCTECVERIGKPCSWVEDDLCSACNPSRWRAAKEDPEKGELWSWSTRGEEANPTHRLALWLSPECWAVCLERDVDPWRPNHFADERWVEWLVQLGPLTLSWRREWMRPRRPAPIKVQPGDMLTLSISSNGEGSVVTPAGWTPGVTSHEYHRVRHAD